MEDQNCHNQIPANYWEDPLWIGLSELLDVAQEIQNNDVSVLNANQTGSAQWNPNWFDEFLDKEEQQLKTEQDPGKVFTKAETASYYRSEAAYLGVQAVDLVDLMLMPGNFPTPPNDSNSSQPEAPVPGPSTASLKRSHETEEGPTMYDKDREVLIPSTSSTKESTDEETDQIVKRSKLENNSVSPLAIPDENEPPVNSTDLRSDIKTVRSSYGLRSRQSDSGYGRSCKRPCSCCDQVDATPHVRRPRKSRKLQQTPTHRPLVIPLKKRVGSRRMRLKNARTRIPFEKYLPEH